MSSFAKMCRTCMLNETKNQEMANRNKVKTKVPQLVSLFMVPEKTKEKLNLLELIKITIPQLKIEENDELPKNVCLECLEKIKEIYSFQQNCLNSEQKLHKMLNEGGNTINQFNDDVFKVELDDYYIEEKYLHTDEEMAIEEEINRAAEAKEEFIESCSDLSIDLEWDVSDSDIEFQKEANQSETYETKDSKTELIGGVKVKEELIIPTHTDNIQPKPVARKKKYVESKQSSDHQQVYPCNKCKRKLKSEISLKKHQEMHDNKEQTYKCSICQEVFEDRSLLKDHMRSHNGEKVFLCSECGKGYTTAGGLKEHSFRHQNEKRFSCPDCPRSFTTKTDLISHHIMHKGKPKNHICDICGRGFHKPFLLKKHKMYHNNERPFACEFCEKCFVTNEKLKRHVRIHTGEKPYKCNYCKNAYCQSNELIKHLRSHLGENVYQCEMCPLRFKTVKILRIHFSTHKDDDEETKTRNLAELNALDMKGVFFK